MHANNYLTTYKNKKETPRWLALLIQKVIDTNAAVDGEDKNLIYRELLNAHNIDYGKIIKVPEKAGLGAIAKSASSQKQKLILQKITHIKGVNALLSEESIHLSPTCTVIYGLNGTGKSGYFKIINEITGGTQPKEILHDIRKQNKALEVDIDFTLDGNIQPTYKWVNKQERGIPSLQHVKVFDIDYLPVFLNERESSVDIEPLGLNSFRIITSIIDEFKVKLSEFTNNEKGRLPDLQPLLEIIHSTDLQNLLQQDSLSADQQQFLDDLSPLSIEEARDLQNLKKTKKTFENNLSENLKTVLKKEKEEIDELGKYLLEIKTKLYEYTSDTAVATRNLLKAKRTRLKRLEEFNILQKIPRKDTEQWQLFLESAEKYDQIINISSFDSSKTCIYCHQSLNEEAILMLQAYSSYLSDQSQQDVDNSLETIASLQTNAGNFIINVTTSKNLDALLDIVCEKQNNNYKTLLSGIIETAQNQLSNIKSTLKSAKKLPKRFDLDLLGIDKYLQQLSIKKKELLDTCDASDQQKEERISAIENLIHQLEDRDNTHKWQGKINNHFKKHANIINCTNANQALNTRGITELSVKAHEELLTDSIREAFMDELKNLGKEDIEVSLEKAGAGKGAVSTKLVILGNNINSILSDGEQKAIGIALFLAEAKSQGDENPIVLDDPVTSVDHEVADSLAKRLLALSLNRQIIIFTHNKLFYDSLIYWGNNSRNGQNQKEHHICKNYTPEGCNGAGRHIYTYRMDRNMHGGVGRVLNAQNESSEYYIRKIEKELNKTDYSSVSIGGHLKSAIEHLIDEKILLKVGLMKDRMQKQNIPWEMLKQIKSKKQEIETLEGYWTNLSNRGTHTTRGSSENPLSLAELQKMTQYIKQF